MQIAGLGKKAAPLPILQWALLKQGWAEQVGGMWYCEITFLPWQNRCLRNLFEKSWAPTYYPNNERPCLTSVVDSESWIEAPSWPPWPSMAAWVTRDRTGQGEAEERALPTWHTSYLQRGRKADIRVLPPRNRGCLLLQIQCAVNTAFRLLSFCVHNKALVQGYRENPRAPRSSGCAGACEQ